MHHRRRRHHHECMIVVLKLKLILMLGDIDASILPTHRDGEQRRIPRVYLATLVFPIGGLDVVIRKGVPFTVEVGAVHDATIVIGHGVLVVQALVRREDVADQECRPVEGRGEPGDDGVRLGVGARGEGSRRAREDVAGRRLGEFGAAKRQLAVRHLCGHGAVRGLRVDGHRLAGELGPGAVHVVVVVPGEEVRLHHHALVGREGAQVLPVLRRDDQLVPALAVGRVLRQQATADLVQAVGRHA